MAWIPAFHGLKGSSKIARYRDYITVKQCVVLDFSDQCRNKQNSWQKPPRTPTGFSLAVPAIAISRLKEAFRKMSFGAWSLFLFRVIMNRFHPSYFQRPTRSGLWMILCLKGQRVSWRGWKAHWLLVCWTTNAMFIKHGVCAAHSDVVKSLILQRLCSGGLSF